MLIRVVLISIIFKRTITHRGDGTHYDIIALSSGYVNTKARSSTLFYYDRAWGPLFE